MCFTQDDKCIQYTGQSNPSIGIEQNMKQSEFNARIVSLLLEIKSKLDDCGCSQVTDVDVNLTNSIYREFVASKCINDIVTRIFSYSVVKDANIKFSYDASTFASSLPAGIVLESLRVRIISNNKLIANISGISSAITFSASEIPAIARFEVRLDSTCGSIIASKSINIYAESVSSSTQFDIEDASSTVNLKSQNEFNDLIYNKLITLESKLK